MLMDKISKLSTHFTVSAALVGLVTALLYTHARTHRKVSFPITNATTLSHIHVMSKSRLGWFKSWKIRTVQVFHLYQA